MQERPGEEQFIPEAIDEQIAQLKQGNLSETAEARLVRDLERMHHEEREEEQAIERIRERLLARASHTLSASEQPLAPKSAPLRRKGIERMNTTHRERTGRQAWARRWGVLAAAIIAALVVGSLITVLQMTRMNQMSHTGGPGMGTSKQKATTKNIPESTPPPSPSQGMYLGIGNQVVKVSMQTKQVLWRYVVKSDPNDIPAFLHPQVYKPPVVAGEHVYFTAQNGTVYALNVQNGKLSWQRHFQAFIGHIEVVNGVLYTNTDWSEEGTIANDVYALNPADGSVKTKYKIPGSIAGIFDGIMYLTSSLSNGGTNTLTAVKVADGSQLWKMQIDAKQQFNDQIYLKNGMLYASSLHVSEKTANEPRNSYVYMIDPQNGKITWKSPMMGGFVFNIAVGDDGRVYCGAQNHYVYAFDPRLKMNKEMWKYRTITGDVYAAPIVLNGTVYVGQSSGGDNNGNSDHLVALDAATGKQKWITPLKGYTGTGDMLPPVQEYGVIYLGTGTGVQGFTSDSGKEAVTLPIDALYSKKDTDGNGFIPKIAITIAY